MEIDTILQISSLGERAPYIWCTDMVGRLIMPSNILVGFATEISFAKILVPTKTKTCIQKFSPFLEYYNFINIVIFLCSSPANDSFDTHGTPYMRSIECHVLQKYRISVMLSIFRIRKIYWRNCLRKIDNQSPDFVFEVLEIQARGRNLLFELNQ